MDDITQMIREKMNAFEDAHGRLPMGDELMQLRMEVITEYAKANGMPEPDGFVFVRVKAEESECDCDNIDWIEA